LEKGSLDNLLECLDRKELIFISKMIEKKIGKNSLGGEADSR
jgi:hypothetical protein